MKPREKYRNNRKHHSILSAVVVRRYYCFAVVRNRCQWNIQLDIFIHLGGVEQYSDTDIRLLSAIGERYLEFVAVHRLFLLLRLVQFAGAATKVGFAADATRSEGVSYDRPRHCPLFAGRLFFGKSTKAWFFFLVHLNMQETSRSQILRTAGSYFLFIHNFKWECLNKATRPSRKVYKLLINCWFKVAGLTPCCIV